MKGCAHYTLNLARNKNRSAIELNFSPQIVLFPQSLSNSKSKVLSKLSLVYVLSKLSLLKVLSKLIFVLSLVKVLSKLSSVEFS